MSEHYAASAARPDYSHRYHAGNVGDVWKHIVWWALIRALQLDTRPLDIIDCHAGHGEYHLAATGEWTAGIGRLLDCPTEGRPESIDEYLAFVRRFGFEATRLERYPGSPLLLAQLLRSVDSLRCFEIDPEAYTNLVALEERYRFTSSHTDGLTALATEAHPSAERQHLYLLDPPWNVKADWQTIPRAVIEASAGRTNLCVGIWYPIKSYTRVNAMLQTLRDAGLGCLVADLITTPLELRLNRLNGSGLCIVNPPPTLATRIASSGPTVGAACTTRGGFYELRLREWESARTV